ncbi:MAG: hypothetical protein HYX66_08570 [Ignavibacteria bacterium]|nr:hypothetical protein [Ignavibacteria bacterium]
MNEASGVTDSSADFKVRLDQYWKSVAVYAITLIVYVVIKSMWDSTLQQGIVNVVLTDPVVVLLGAFVVASAVTLIANLISRRSLVIGERGITFRSRFHERTFTQEDIESITVGKDRRIRIKGVLSVVKVRIRGRRRVLRIRPAVYDDERRLVSALMSLKSHLRNRAA